MRVGNSGGSRAWQGLLGRRPDWGIGPPRSTGVRKGSLGSLALRVSAGSAGASRWRLELRGQDVGQGLRLPTRLQRRESSRGWAARSYRYPCSSGRRGRRRPVGGSRGCRGAGHSVCREPDAPDGDRRHGEESGARRRLPHRASRPQLAEVSGALRRYAFTGKSPIRLPARSSE
jgi:hypothetical protein